MDFGKWLQDELEKRGWGQAELSRRSGIPTGHLSRVVNGSRNPGPELCISIAEAFGIPREEVFQARGWLVKEIRPVFYPGIDARTEQVARHVSALPFEIRELALDAIEPVVNSIIKVMEEQYSNSKQQAT